MGAAQSVFGQILLSSAFSVHDILIIDQISR